MRFARPYGTQDFIAREIAAGLEDDVHDFLFLKGGRQIGGSTEFDALTPYWLQTHPGMVGEMVSDDQPNMLYRRKVIRSMMASAPSRYRIPVKAGADNAMFLEWETIRTPSGKRLGGSTLLFDFAGIRSQSNLGRSKGLNFLYADEVGSWPDQKAVEALDSALAETYPARLYLWVSTARGFNTFKLMWDEAKKSVTRRRRFVAWWQHAGYSVQRGSREWKRYGGRGPSSSERVWVSAVRKQFRHTITREQLAWFRWKLREKFYGDEAMMAQEFACVPEDAFQAFGDKFIDPALILKMRLALDQAPKPEGLRYEWGETLEKVATPAVDPDRAPLVIWEQPIAGSIYLVAGHPWGSSDPNATEFVAQVYRVWPDCMIQVAEYASDVGTMYQFAWVLLHLAGGYRTEIPSYFISEIGGTGYRVLEEIQMLERHGFGLSPKFRTHLQDVLGSVRHYFYFKPDSPFATRSPQEWKTGADNRPWLLHGLRDAVEQRHITIRSGKTIDQLSWLRRGETGDNDQIAGGQQQSDARALCAALAVECWRQTAIPDLEALIGPHEMVAPGVPKSVEHRLVQDYLQREVGLR